MLRLFHVDYLMISKNPILNPHFKALENPTDSFSIRTVYFSNLYHFQNAHPLKRALVRLKHLSIGLWQVQECVLC